MRSYAIFIMTLVININCLSQNGIYVSKPNASIHNILHGHYKKTGAILIIYDSTKAKWLSWTGGQQLWDMMVTCKVNRDTLFLFFKSQENIPGNIEDKLLIQGKSLVSIGMKGLVYKKRKRIPKKAVDLFSIIRDNYKF